MVRAPRALAVAAMLAAILAAPATVFAQLPPVPSTPDSDSDTEGHETPNPEDPDHARAQAWHITGEDEFEDFNLTLAETSAEVDEDGRTRGEARAFRAGPFDPTFVQTDSREGPGSASASPTSPQCLEGLVCFGAFYATSQSSEDSSSSHSLARSGIAEICVLPFEDQCDFGFGFMQSKSEVERDKNTGETDSRARTTPAFICLRARDTFAAAVACGSVLSYSNSHSNGGDDGETSRASMFEGQIFVELLGEERFNEQGEYSESESFHFFFEDPPESFEEAEGCPETPVPNGGCGFTNQGESFEFPGGAASRQEALHIVGWGDEEQVIFRIHMGVTHSLARFSDSVLGTTFERGGTGTDVLAFTGGGITDLASAALALLLVGGWSVLVTRRRTFGD